MAKKYRLEHDDGRPVMKGKLRVESDELEHAQLTAYFGNQLGLKLRVVRNEDNALMGQMQLFEVLQQIR